MAMNMPNTFQAGLDENGYLGFSADAMSPKP